MGRRKKYRNNPRNGPRNKHEDNPPSPVTLMDNNNDDLTPKLNNFLKKIFLVLLILIAVSSIIASLTYSSKFFFLGILILSIIILGSILVMREMRDSQSQLSKKMAKSHTFVTMYKEYQTVWANPVPHVGENFKFKMICLIVYACICFFIIWSSSHAHLYCMGRFGVDPESILAYCIVILLTLSMVIGYVCLYNLFVYVFIFLPSVKSSVKNIFEEIGDQEKTMSQLIDFNFSAIVFSVSISALHLIVKYIGVRIANEIPFKNKDLFYTQSLNNCMIILCMVPIVILVVLSIYYTKFIINILPADSQVRKDYNINRNISILLTIVNGVIAFTDLFDKIITNVIPLFFP